MIVLKPQDFLVLLKKMTSQGKSLTAYKLAEEIGISASSVGESLERCKAAQLVDRSKKRVNTLALQEFLVHGIQYVFPAEAGRVGRGVATYVSASPIQEQLAGNAESYVWHYLKGNARGQQIEPLYPSVPDAALRDPELYQLLVIVDTLRMGRAREREIAIQELTVRINRYVENE